jgi:hypothetical protein
VWLFDQKISKFMRKGEECFDNRFVVSNLFIIVLSLQVLLVIGRITLHLHKMIYLMLFIVLVWRRFGSVGVLFAYLFILGT